MGLTSGPRFAHLSDDARTLDFPARRNSSGGQKCYVSERRSKWSVVWKGCCRRGSLHRRTTDFAGRLFRDAGLLPKERDREHDRDEETSPRQTSPIYSRSSMDRERMGECHRQMVPSRTGYSEVSATSSTWGRTRATPSVVSERVGTPFTSSSSSTPTSVTSSLP